MTTIARVLGEKGRDIWSVSPDDTVYDAIKLMAEKGVGALLVMDGDRLAGIISERDYARKVILQDRSSKDTPVRDIMTATVYYIEPGRSVEDGMALMTSRRIRHLPVVEGGRVAGIVSIGDLVKTIMEDRESQIENLERYITGGR
ncbi:MAG TPA: CBS domain-containing protein [Chloroflexota bacterium]|nr:CBS domain-containing protein [Chloroflexota bacterium]